MRFFKIFLICFASIIGITGAALGIMYLTGYFNEAQIYPDQIEFVMTEYEVDNDFKMMITTPTEEANMLDVTLSFDGMQSVGNTISDGVIILPKYVKIGQEFDVQLVKSTQNFDGTEVEWIKGGISTVVATSQNINARSTSAKVFVDVPVYKINVKTATSSDFNADSLTNVFNISSQFFAKAEFIPAQSQYKYSRDTNYGGEVQYKTIFFETQSTAIQKQTTDDLDKFTNKYTALMRADNVAIVAQAFAKSSDENNAYDTVKDLSDDLKQENLLALLRQAIEDEKAVAGKALVNFNYLVVGGFSADATSTVPTTYFAPTKIFANKTNLAQNEFSLGANIFATDNQTSLPENIKYLALAVLKETTLGYAPASIYPASNADVSLSYSAQVEAGTINGMTVKLYKPIQNTVDINHSYWEITPIKENTTLKLALVLLDGEDNIRAFSYIDEDDTQAKYLYSVQEAQSQSQMVYWTDALSETKSLYTYMGEDGTPSRIDTFDLKTLTKMIPLSNTFKDVRYFAYLQSDNGEIDTETDLSEYIIVEQTNKQNYEYQISSGLNAVLYELPDGILTPVYNNNDYNGKICVLFATVKTDFSGKVLYDADNNYIIDRFSSNSTMGTVQTIQFQILRTLDQVQATAQFETQNVQIDTDNDLLAVKSNTVDAFNLLFQVPQGQEDVFVRDYNNGKIQIVFLVNGEENSTLLSCQTTSFAAGTTNFVVPVSIADLDYHADDLGYRNIGIKIVYTKPDGDTDEFVITDFVLADAPVVDPEQPTNIYSTLQVYDGKISTIAFDIFDGDNAVDPTILNSQNPINVATSLTKAKAGSDDIVANGIFTAEKGSTYSIVFAGNDVKQQLLGDENKISITAKDKYGVIIEETADLLKYELVSSNPKVLAVNNVTKQISFVGTSQQVVELSVRTYAQYGAGNNVVECENKLYFVIATGGQVVRVDFEDPQTQEVQHKFDNIAQVTQDNEPQNLFTLKSDSKFDSAIEITVTGKKSNSYDLTNTPIISFYYGILTDTKFNSQDTYEVYDLKNIIKWSLVNDDFADSKFISFETDQADGSIKNFAITQNFGKTGYLKLKAESDIGVNVLVTIVIEPVIEASTKNTYDNSADGASQDIASGHTYSGVYAENPIKITFGVYQKGQSQVFKGTFYPLWYIYDETTSAIIASGSSTVTISDTNQDFDINITFDDVNAIQKYVVVMILYSEQTSVAQTIGQEKLTYDFSTTIYFNVNPNIKAQLNNSSDDTISLEASNQTVVQDILNTADATQPIISVLRKVANSAITFSGTQPYAYVRITDDKGNEVSNRYFQIDGNSLKIRNGQLISGTQTLRLSVFFGDTKLATYTLQITAKLEEGDLTETFDDGTPLSQKMGFVTYNSKRYLQILANNEYTLQDFAKCFKSDDKLITVSFDDVYKNQFTYWNIQTQSIFVNASFIMLVDRLSINVQIEGTGVKTFDIIIMPQLAPLAVYDDNASTNNTLANNDLYINQTVEELIQNDVYDIANDGSTISVFKSDSKAFGIIRNTQSVYSFAVVDGNDITKPVTFASIDADGNLTLDYIGEDSYIIVVAQAGTFKIYYRLKVTKSLELQSFYPYVQNVDDDKALLEDRAEYINFNEGDLPKTITLTQNFDGVIPATKEQLLENTYINNRFMLFRYEQGQRIEKLDYQSLKLEITNIQRGYFGSDSLVDIAKSNFGMYAVVQTLQDGNAQIYIENQGNFVITLKATTSSNASCIYCIAVTKNNDVYSVVQAKNSNGEETDDILQMIDLDDEPIMLNSPLSDTTDFEQVDTTTLDTYHLKHTSGSSISDQTDQLQFALISSQDYIRLVGKTIEAKYTPNTINATLVMYNKYGVVATKTVNIVSNMTIIGKSNEEITKLSIYSGCVFDFEQEIFVAERNGDILARYNGTVEYNSIVIQNAENIDFIINMFDPEDNTSTPKLVILPLQNDSEDITINARLTLDGDKTFEYTIVLKVLSGYVSNAASSVAPLQLPTVVSTKNKEISVFNSELSLFGAENAPDFAKDAQGRIQAVLSGNQKYLLTYEILSGNDAVTADGIGFASNKFTIKTKAVAQDTTVKIKFVLSLENDIYRFEITSYCLFVVTPDSEVTTTYPTLEDTTFDSDSIQCSSTFVLDDPASFTTQKRVEVTPNQGIDNVDIRVTAKILSGEVNINVDGMLTDVDEIAAQLTSNFSFDFEDLNSEYAKVEFTIWVSELSRATYTLEVFAAYSKMYQVEVATVNEKEGNDEVFYLADGREDIFNGPQAFRFIVTSSQTLLENELTLKYYIDGQQNALGEFTLNSADKGVTKTVDLQLDTSKILLSLNLQNIRFTINESDTMYTLEELSQGDLPLFTRDASGNINFEIINRITVKFIKNSQTFDVTQYADFLKDKLKASQDDTPTALDNFKLSSDGLGKNADTGENVTAVSHQVNIIFGDEILGNYNYVIKSGISIKNTDEIQIVADETISKLMEYLGVVDKDDNLLITYDQNNQPILPNIVTDKMLLFEMNIAEFNSGYSYKYYGTDEDYKESPKVMPLTTASSSSKFDSSDKMYAYDFEIKAHGAPNSGLLCNLIFRWTYALTDSKDENIVFEQIIPVKIKPNLSILLKNLDGSENSISNPQVIEDYTTELGVGIATLTIADKANSSNYIVKITKTNAQTFENLALNDDITYTSSSSFARQTSDTSGTKYIVVTRPDFAEQDIQITIKDSYGYSAIYYITATPSKKITFSELTGSSAIYEGDTIALHIDDQEVVADHKFKLSKTTDFADINISFALFTTDGTPLYAISPDTFSGAATIFSIGYLNNNLFGANYTINAYLQITLKNTLNNEEYVINSDTFPLRQRYVSSVEQTYVRDGAEFDISDYIQILDKKYEQKIGIPQLFDDYTLQIKDKYVTALTVNGQDSISTKDSKYINNIGTITSNYISLAQTFGKTNWTTDATFTITNLEMQEYVDGTGGWTRKFTITNSTLVSTLKSTKTGDEATEYTTKYDVILSDGTNIKIVHIDGTETAEVLDSELWYIIGVFTDNNYNDYYSLSIDLIEGITTDKYDMLLYLGNVDDVQLLSDEDLENFTIVGTDYYIKNIKFSTDKQDEGIFGTLDITQGSNTTNYNIYKQDNKYYINLRQNISLDELKPAIVLTDKRLEVITTLNETEYGSKTIDILFNGDNRKITVNLNKNDKQTFSLRQQFGDKYSDDIALATQPISDSDLETLYEINIWDDTLQIVAGANSGSVMFNIKRERDGEVVVKEFTISQKSYKNSTYKGLTELFDEQVPQVGDIYTLILKSKASSLEYLKICTPYTFEDGEGNKISQKVITNFDVPTLVTFRIEKDFANNSIQQNKKTLLIDSLQQYNADIKYVYVSQYYIADYRGARYVISPQFAITPYVYELNLNNVGDKTENGVMINAYTQGQNSEGETAYTISFDEWSKNIRFNDYDQQVVSKDGEVLTFKQAYESGLIKALITTDDITGGGAGSAYIADNGDIISVGNVDIVNTHITIKIQVALNGDSSLEEYLYICDLTLYFNAQNLTSINAGTEFVLANREQSEGDNSFTETFRFVDYSSEADSPINFSALKFFEGNTVDIKNVKLVVSDNNTEDYGKRYYLPEYETNTYQISYYKDKDTSIACMQNSQVLDFNAKFVAIYGLPTGANIKLESRTSADSTDFVYANITNTTGSRLYGTQLLSSLSWYDSNNAKTSLTADYVVFTATENASNCCVMQSYLEIPETLQNMGYYYSGSENSPTYDDDKLINNSYLNYSNLFEITPIDGTSKVVKVAVGANSTNYFQITEIDENGNMFSNVYSVKNEANMSALKNIDLYADENVTGIAGGASTIKIVKNITDGSKFAMTTLSYLGITNKFYRLDFANSSVSIFAKLDTEGNAIKEFSFANYLCGQDISTATGAVDNNYYIKATPQTNSSTVNTATGYPYCTVINNTANTKFTYYLTSSSYTINETALNDFGTENYNVITVIRSSSQKLAWHQYMDEDLANGELYFTAGNRAYTVTSKDITHTDDTITDLWDGLYSMEGYFNRSASYTLAIDGTELLSFVAEAFITNNKINVTELLENTTVSSMPKLSQIEIKLFANSDFWTNVQTNLSDGQYIVKYNGTQKAIIDFTNAYNNRVSINSITGLTKVIFDNISFEKTTITNAPTPVLLWVDDDIYVAISISEYFAKGYIKKGTTIKCKAIGDITFQNTQNKDVNGTSIYIGDSVIKQTITNTNLTISLNTEENLTYLKALVASGRYEITVRDSDKNIVLSYNVKNQGEWTTINL